VNGVSPDGIAALVEVATTFPDRIAPFPEIITSLAGDGSLKRWKLDPKMSRNEDGASRAEVSARTSRTLKAFNDFISICTAHTM
jgi:hypothetical protein